jgi:TATA-box binding protein (TBP) (component of TFIID and TFIIIB)
MYIVLNLSNNFQTISKQFFLNRTLGEEGKNKMEALKLTGISIHPAKELSKEGDPNAIDFEYKVINVVCLGILELEKVGAEITKIDFSEVEKKIEVKRLNRFPCVMFKLKMKTGESISCILFRNGKMIITGVKHQDSIPTIKKDIEKKLHEGGINFSGFTIDIQNLVVMTNLHRTINLEMSCLTLTNCLYEPEQFPAAIVKQDKSTCLIFSNSKIISLGNKTEAEMKTSLTNLIQNIFDNDLFIKIPEDDDELDDLDDDLFF